MGHIDIHIDHLANHRYALPEIVSWVHAEWGNLMPDISYSKLESQFKERLTPHVIPETFVAMRGDQIVGTASIVTHDLSTRMDLSPWLAAVFVLPEHRGMGVGSALVQAGVDEAGYLGLERFYLLTPDRISFYARLGWVKLFTTEYRGENVSVMVYQIQEPQ
jgi:GNAT superfamily N-acetyltransferase